MNIAESLSEVLAIGLGFSDAEASFGGLVVWDEAGRWGWVRKEFVDVRDEAGKVTGARWSSSKLPIWFESYRALDAYIWGFDYEEEGN